MKRIVPIEMQDGSVIYAEVDETEIVEARPATRGEPERVSRRLPEVEPTEIKRRFETAIETIKPAVASIVSNLKEIDNPSKINLEVGINFSATLGAVVASTSSDVAIKIALEWDNNKNRSND